MHSQNNCRCIQNPWAPADPEEKKTRTFPGTLDQCHITLGGNTFCIPKGALKITSSLLTSFSPSRYETAKQNTKAKGGGLKATSVGPALLPGGDRDARGMLCYALHQEQ